MHPVPVRLVKVVGLGFMLALPRVAAGAEPQAPAAPPPRIEVCSLVPKAEVKKQLPWQDSLDAMPVEEEPVGTTGSSCSYPSVHVQVLAYTRSFLDTFRKAGALEAIPGLGDEAWFRHNRKMFAEIVVKVGPRLLTLQADADDDVAAVRPRVIDLARVYVARLR